jgi:hypothetical protein
LASVSALKRLEVLFELPLKLRFFAARHVLPAATRTEPPQSNVQSALGHRHKPARVAPQAPARDERILETIPRHRFQLNIPQPLFLGGFQKFTRYF